MDNEITPNIERDQTDSRAFAEELAAIGDASGAVVGTDVTTPQPDQTSKS